MASSRRTRTPAASPPIETHRIHLSADGMGETGHVQYQLIRSARRRRTIEVLVREGAVTVRAPLRASHGEIHRVVHQRAAWILERMAEAPSPSLATGATVPFRGDPLTLTVSEARVETPTVTLDLFGIRVELPADAAEAELMVRDALATWLRQRAEELIPCAVAARAGETGQSPRRVLVRDQRRR